MALSPKETMRLDILSAFEHGKFSPVSPFLDPFSLSTLTGLVKKGYLMENRRAVDGKISRRLREVSASRFNMTVRNVVSGRGPWMGKIRTNLLEAEGRGEYRLTEEGVKYRSELQKKAGRLVRTFRPGMLRE